MVSDLVTLVENAYRLHATNADWLRDVLIAAAPLLNRGKGVYGYEFDASDPDKFDIGEFAALEGTTIVPDFVRKWHASLSRNNLGYMYRGSVPYATISQRLRHSQATPASEAMQGFCQRIGIFDQLTLRAADPTLHGVTLCTPLGEVGQANGNESVMWAKVSAHVSAGYRLRRAMAALKKPALADHAEAILSPDGKVQHAEAPAKSGSIRDKLRHAAIAIDRARGKLRSRDPHQALDIWRGLVDGQWSLVDHFDSDGRRFLVALRNTPATPDPRAFTARERQVCGYASLGLANKEIAYALGLSTNTIAGYLASAMRKLDCSSRVHLIQVWTGLEGAGTSH